MAQKIKQGNIFGRLGSGIGQGLAEQIPKEIERSRFSSGLENLSKQKGLTPQEFFTKGLAIPGAMDRPSVVQALADLSRQQTMSNLFSEKEARGKLYAPSAQDFSGQQEFQENYPSVTTEEGVNATIKPFIPPTFEKQVQESRDLMKKNPGLDFNTALQSIQNKYAQEEKINQAQINKRNLEQDVQTRTENELKNEISTLVGGDSSSIPGEIISNLQNEAIDAVRTGKMTEKQAAKHFGKKGQEIDRQYTDAKALGDYTLLFKNPKEVSSTIDGLQKKFAARGDQKNLAKTLVSESGFSPPYAYSRAYPIKDIPKLNEEINSLPSLKPKVHYVPGAGGFAGVSGVPKKEKTEKTLEAVKKIAPLLKREKGISPLSVYYALEEKGYDPEVWKKYLLDNQDDLDLSLSQLDELTKSRGSFQGWLNDTWIKVFGG